MRPPTVKHNEVSIFKHRKNDNNFTFYCKNEFFFTGEYYLFKIHNEKIEVKRMGLQSNIKAKLAVKVKGTQAFSFSINSEFLSKNSYTICPIDSTEDELVIYFKDQIDRYNRPQ
jgi:hypothetical protein